MRTHDGALGDLVLLDVMEVLRDIAVGPVVDAFVGVGALDRLGSHVFHFACQESSPYSGRRVWNSGGYETRPRAEFRRRRTARPDHRRRALLRSSAPAARAQVPGADVLAGTGADLRRRRVWHLAQRPHLA